ncbi:zf-CCHC domain-containing protein [Tanacetum coccineum]
MDDLDITIEEYIQLMADKARGCDKTFNWETARYGNVYYDDFDPFIDFETDFPAIIYNDASTSNQNVSSEPTVSIYNAIKSDIDFHISFFYSEDEDYTFIYNKDSSSYKLIPANDLNPKPVNDYVEINIESSSKNINVKPMDSVIRISKDTTPIEFDENIETYHDTQEVQENEVFQDMQLIQKLRDDQKGMKKVVEDMLGIEEQIFEKKSRKQVDLLSYKLILSSNVGSLGLVFGVYGVKVIRIKVNVFAWRLRLDSLPTRLNLSLRDLEIPSIVCHLCNVAVESTSHLLFSCSLARQVRSKLMCWWELDDPEIRLYDEWLNWLNNIRLSKNLKDVLEGVSM